MAQQVGHQVAHSLVVSIVTWTPPHWYKMNDEMNDELPHWLALGLPEPKRLSIIVTEQRTTWCGEKSQEGKRVV
jgi:hypothetical protein